MPSARSVTVRSAPLSLVEKLSSGVHIGAVKPALLLTTYVRPATIGLKTIAFSVVCAGTASIRTWNRERELVGTSPPRYSKRLLPPSPSGSARSAARRLLDNDVWHEGGDDHAGAGGAGNGSGTTTDP